RETRSRYDETVRLSRARFKAGDISEAELKKIELESLKYQNGEIDAQMELDLAWHKLAALLGFGSPAALPSVAAEKPPERAPLSLSDLTARALNERPDLRAVRMSQRKAQADLSAARREALPEPALGVAYTHDDFTVSGDNPNSLALTLSFPLPLFDRNQGGIGRAQVDLRRAGNDEQKLLLAIQREVAEAVRRARGARRPLPARRIRGWRHARALRFRPARGRKVVQGRGRVAARASGGAADLHRDPRAVPAHRVRLRAGSDRYRSRGGSAGSLMQKLLLL